MSVNIYEWRSLTNAVNKVKTQTPFLLDLFFSGNKVQHNADSFDFEEITGNSKVAQFSTAQSQTPKSVSKQTRITKTLSIPRTYEEKGFAASELAKFKPTNDGMIYVGSAADIASAATQAILQEVGDLKSRVIGRREVMAAQAIATGAVTVVVDGNTRTADFGFTSDHLITLSGGNLWSATSTSDILGNLRTWKKAIIKRTGYGRIACVMGGDAAAWFIKDTKVMAALNNLNYQVGKLDLNTVPADRASRYLGYFEGVEYYVYDQDYQDTAGSDVAILGAGQVVMGALGNPNNRMHLGTVVRMGDNGQTLAFANEMVLYPVVNQNKTGVSWELEQKSLPAIHEANGFISASVL